MHGPLNVKQMRLMKLLTLQFTPFSTFFSVTSEGKIIYSCVQCDIFIDRLCVLGVRVSGYRYRDLGFDSRRYHIF